MSTKSGRRVWDLGALAVGEFRVVPVGVPLPRAAIRKARQNTGYTFSTRKSEAGGYRIWRVK